jgi:Ca2+/Na+ antiporter
MLEYIGVLELTLLSVMLIVGVFMVVFSSEGVLFLGVSILMVMMSILYGSHTHYLEEQFMLQRFSDGQSLQCGLWRGELTLVNPHNGWRWDKEIGFIKNDQIIGDIDLCKLVEEKEEISLLVLPFGYMGVYLVLIALLVSIRSLVQALVKTEKKDDTDDI